MPTNMETNLLALTGTTLFIASTAVMRMISGWESNLSYSGGYDAFEFFQDLMLTIKAFENSADEEVCKNNIPKTCFKKDKKNKR